MSTTPLDVIEQCQFTILWAEIYLKVGLGIVRNEYA